MEPNQHWAYRPRRDAKFTEVVILTVGAGKHPKVRVEFVDDKYEGKREWVRGSRLEVEWANSAEYIALDLRWKELVAASFAPGLEGKAAEEVFMYCLTAEVAFMPWGSKAVTVVYDVTALSNLTGMSVEELTSDPLCITENGNLWVPWATTRKIAVLLARQNPMPLFRHIEEKERKARIECVLGLDAKSIFEKGVEVHIPAEHLARLYEEEYAPLYELLREWAGSEQSTYRQELVEAREELTRVGEIAQRAIRDLKMLRSNRTADALLHELINPPSRYQGHGLTSHETRRGDKWIPRYRWVLKDGPPPPAS